MPSMLSKLILENTSLCFTRMKALTWAANESVLSTIVQSSAGSALARLYTEFEPSKPLFVDCGGITEIDDHALTGLNEAVRNSARPLVLWNMRSLSILIEQSMGYPESILTKDLDNVVFVYHPLPGWSETSVEALIADAYALESSHIQLLVKDCFTLFEKPQRLSSTPIEATGVFNARKIIGQPSSFVWIALNMAMKVDELIAQTTPANPCLLAVSLRGSAFAGAIKVLSTTEMPLQIIDHLGPRHKILEEHSLQRTAAGIDYIYVADFIIGGTELRTAQAYAHSSGSSVTRGVVIGTALSPEIYSSYASVSLVTVVSLSECCSSARYAFLSQGERV